MTDEPGLEPLQENRERETWVRLAVLGVCVIAVGVYTARTAGLGEALGQFIADHAPSAAVLLFSASIGSLLTLLAMRMAARPNAEANPGVRDPIRPRTGLMDSLAALIARSSSEKTRSALHLVDLDRFGQVNLSLGEAAGDQLLKRVEEQLRILVESPGDLARIGDDEFGLLQPEAGGSRHVEIFARRIRAAVEDACADLPAHLRPTCSIGAALSLEPGCDPREMLKQASAALLSVKRAGGGGFRLYAAEMETARGRRAAVEEAVRAGLDEGWFHVAFQPQYDLDSRRLMGFEALARLHHPEHGDVPPEEFLAVAESLGLLPTIGAWVIGRAIATAAEWPLHLALSINVSAAQFRESDVAEAIVTALAESCFEGTRLNVEITESVLWRPSEAVARQLRRLKRRGVRIVLDDFGVETSALHASVRSSCDAIKLDRSFVQRLGREPEADAVVRGLIGTAQAFDLGILAEGVENPEQAHFLMSHSCRKVQGFLFGRPAPLAELGAIIARDMRKGIAAAEAEPRRSAYPPSIAARRMSR
jgi:diguanylate cyclase (GGDEF)-like protein